MSNIIDLFPSITENDINDIFSIGEYELYYKYNQNDVKLSLVEGLFKKLYTIYDSNGIWNFNDYDLFLKRTIKIEDPSSLYYNDNSANNKNAIACHDATLGIAIIWTSKDSNQKEVIPVEEIQSFDIGKEITAEFKIPKRSVRGVLSFYTIIYIKNSGHPTSTEFIYANTPGINLGTIDEFNLAVDGNGSSFPIYEVEKKGYPLWYVECFWKDATIDDFSQYVAIYLNTAHPKYVNINIKDKNNFSSQLFIEIMANAIGQIIETLRSEEKDDGFSILDDAQEGSVALAIKYFRDKLEWDLSTPSNLSLSIRKTLEEKFKDL